MQRVPFDPFVEEHRGRESVVSLVGHVGQGASQLRPSRGGREGVGASGQGSEETDPGRLDQARDWKMLFGDWQVREGDGDGVQVRGRGHER